MPPPRAQSASPHQDSTQRQPSAPLPAAAVHPHPGSWHPCRPRRRMPRNASKEGLQSQARRITWRSGMCWVLGPGPRRQLLPRRGRRRRRRRDLLRRAGRRAGPHAARSRPASNKIKDPCGPEATKPLESSQLNTSNVHPCPVPRLAAPPPGARYPASRPRLEDVDEGGRDAVGLQDPRVPGRRVALQLPVVGYEGIRLAGQRFNH